MKQINIIMKYLLSCSIFMLIMVNSSGFAEENEKLPPHINASAAVLMEADTGRVLFEKNMHNKRSPASLTKMMTAILAIELGKPQEVVTISPSGAGNKVGQDIGLQRKDKITLAHLTTAALLVSANDSTVAIAEYLGGSEGYFVHLMNMKAKSIGAFNTNFKNTNGYTEPNHYSTAYDLALIARYGLVNKNFARLVMLDEANIKWINRDKELTLINTNRLQREYEWITGVKTGTTNAAGKCLAASGEKNNQTLIAVVLNSSNRYGEALRLLEYGFSLQKEVVARGEKLNTITIAKGEPEEVGIVSLASKSFILTPDELSRLSIQIAYDDEKLNRFPIEVGQEIGKAKAVLDGQVLAEIPVGVNVTVTRKSWLK